MTRPLIALVHATPLAIAPATEAFGQEFPGADLWHLLDDRLARDADDAGGLTPALRRRMQSLIEHAVLGGAHAVQLTCSMYGSVARAARELWEVPVSGSDEQMFAAVAERQPARVGVVGSLESAVHDSIRRLAEVLGGPTGTALLPLPAPRARDGELVEALTDAVKPHRDEIDLLVLAQYSLAPAQPALAESLGLPVLSAPALAARQLRERLGVTS